MKLEQPTFVSQLESCTTIIEANEARYCFDEEIRQKTLSPNRNRFFWKLIELSRQTDKMGLFTDILFVIVFLLKILDRLLVQYRVVYPILSLFRILLESYTKTSSCTGLMVDGRLG